MAYYLYKMIRDRHRSTTGDIRLRGTEDHPFSSAAADSTDRGGQSHEVSIMTSGATASEKQDGLNDSPEAADNGVVARQEKREMRKYRWKLMGGLLFPAVVQGLSNTMIAAALPFIGSDFNQLGQLNWIIAAYNLTSAAFIPAWSQFANIFGRYWAMQSAIIIMIFGSALCAGAPLSNFPMLLAGRGIQGAGSAGILILEKVILADKVSLKENAKNNTVFTLIIGIGYSIGPTIGGYLTTVSWRWCFIIDIPLSLVGLLLIHLITRSVLVGPQDLPAHDGVSKLSSKATFIKRISTIDFGGQLLFLFGMGLFILALTWAGSAYPWSSVEVLVPLIVGVVLLGLFFIWEYLLLPGQKLALAYPHQQAMIPLKLLRRRNASILMYINLVTGMAMYAVFYFVELYFTMVRQFGSGEAGVNLLFYVPGLGGGAYIAMFLCNIWPRKTWHPLSFGTIVEAVGITVLAASLSWGHLPTIYGMLALTGVGTGIRFMPGTLHGVGYFRTHIASIISMMNLSHAIGGALASTIMLNIFNNRLSDAGIDLNHGTSTASSFSAIAQMTPERQAYLRSHAKEAIVVAFYGISSFMWLGVIGVAFMGNVNIKKHSQEPDTYADGETEVGSLTKGSYLGSLFRRTEARSIEDT